MQQGLVHNPDPRRGSIGSHRPQTDRTCLCPSPAVGVRPAGKPGTGCWAWALTLVLTQVLGAGEGSPQPRGLSLTWVGWLWPALERGRWPQGGRAVGGPDSLMAVWRELREGSFLAPCQALCPSKLLCRAGAGLHSPSAAPCMCLSPMALRMGPPGGLRQP